MVSHKLIKLILFSLLFFLIINIVFEYGKFVPYFEKNIINTLTLSDKPFLKDISIFYDLSIALIFFLFIFNLLKKIPNFKNTIHLQILWVIKCFISFFLIIILENNFGKDQYSYFGILINNDSYNVVFGDLTKILDKNYPTANFLIPLKLINFIFSDSWFMQKLFQNILYISSLILFLKIIEIIENNLSNNIFLIYFIGLIPSFIFFSSFITKDLLVIFLISLTTYSFLSLGKKLKKNVQYLILIIFSISYIFLLRNWVAYALIISIFLFYLLNLLKILNFSFIHVILFSIIIFFIYTDSFHLLLNEISISMFDRFKMEHFFPKQDYETLFINKGERLEVLLMYPKALYKTLFNPFILDIKNVKYFIFILENFILFLLLLNSFYFLKKNLNLKIFFIFCIFFILVTVYTPIGYLNTGTTIRYILAPKLLFFIFLILINKDLFNGIDNKLRNLFFTRKRS